MAAQYAAELPKVLCARVPDFGVRLGSPQGWLSQHSRKNRSSSGVKSGDEREKRTHVDEMTEWGEI